MNKMPKFTSRLVVFGTALVMMARVTAASAQTNYPGSAKVVSIKGATRYTANSANWLPMKVGDILKPGAFIQTAASSQVELRVNGQDMVRLHENTVLGMDKLTRMEAGADWVTETQLDLRMGTIDATVKKFPGGSKHEVRFPNGVAGIRSPATYSISDSGAVNVTTGSVAIAKVASDGSVTTQVASGGDRQEATAKGAPEASDKESNRTSKRPEFSAPPRRF